MLCSGFQNQRAQGQTRAGAGETRLGVGGQRAGSEVGRKFVPLLATHMGPWALSLWT